MAEVLHSVGYAHAFEPDRRALGIRTFSGHVVSVKKFPQLPSSPGIYELSFSCPRGLSGAPLFTPGGEPRMCGVVIGNASMEMEVLRSREVVKEGTETIVERYEALQLGIAIRTSSILQVDSPKILSGSVESHLQKHGLL